MRRTVHAGEPGAGIPPCARIEEAWGARSFDHAGMTEMGAYGYECAEQVGLHVQRVRVHRRGHRSGHGLAGSGRRAVLTNLGRVGSLAVRYRTGDRVRLDERPCPGGRTFVHVAGRILGCLDDMLIVRGVNVFPSAVEEIVRRFPPVEEFQIEVSRQGELDEIRVLLDAPGGVDAHAVQKALRRGLGIRVEVAAVAPRSLPRYELKARRVVRRTAPGGA